jgi:hypothetical protein
MDLMYATGEMSWMTGVILVGVIYGVFALVWGKK